MILVLDMFKIYPFVNPSTLVHPCARSFNFLARNWLMQLMPWEEQGMAVDFMTEQACSCRSRVLASKASKTCDFMPNLSSQSSLNRFGHSNHSIIRLDRLCVVLLSGVVGKVMHCGCSVWFMVVLQCFSML